jgi:arabinofuranosyltransferase
MMHAVPATAVVDHAEATEGPRVEMRAARPDISSLLLAIVIGAFVLVAIRTAWICDDAYINFRTIDNFLHGYGLRWNVAERVQTFTDPLWLFLVAASVGITKEFYFTTIVLSIAASAAAIAIYVKLAAPDRSTAACGVVLLLSSKAFVDYSTGGLENPLAHLLIVTFLALYGRWDEPEPRQIRWLTLLATLSVLTRMDTALLIMPSLAAAVISAGVRRSVVPVAAAATPLLAWLMFSIVYYGQPLPNTAYAKLGGGAPRFELVEQGFYFLFDSIARDPLTLTVICGGVCAPFIIGRPRDRAVAAGMLLTLVYIVAIGGDFMSGRFLAAPFLCGVVLLTRAPWRLPRHLVIVPALVLFAAAASSQAAPLATDRTFHHDFQDRSGTVDERRVYYQYTGLLNAGAGGADAHPWARHAREVLASGERATIYIANGFFGFTLGRRVHVIDPIALSDMLLSRLPAQSDWRPGHFTRRVPTGYLETIASGENRIAEPAIAALYEKVRLIVSGPLFSRARLQAIWRLNTGGYADLVAGSSYGLQRVGLSDVAAPFDERTPTHTAGVRQVREGGLEVDLGRTMSGGRFEISVDANDDYMIFYGDHGRDRCHQLLRARSPHSDGSAGLAIHRIDVPPCAGSFDRIRVSGRHGYGAFFFGHLRRLE